MFVKRFAMALEIIKGYGLCFMGIEE